MCGLNSPFLRLWGFACSHPLGSRSGSKRNFWWLCWFGEWSLVVWWVCDPELDALMGVSCSVLVAVLVRCTVLCLSSVLTSVTPVLGQIFSLLLVLPWPLWPWVCVFCSFPYRLYITKLLVSWEGGHMLPPSVAFVPLWSLFSVFSLYFSHPFSALLGFCLWNLLLSLYTLLFGWEKPELLGFPASSFSTYPFALSLILAPSLCSFLSSPFSCPGNSLCPASSFCDISNMVLHPCCCRTSVLMCLGHSPPWLGQSSLGLSISLLPSLYSVKSVAGKTLFLSNHLACVTLLSTFCLLPSCSSCLIPTFSRP